jgi:hypothetical protein
VETSLLTQNLLAYLGSVPADLLSEKIKGEDIALNLGKFLVWCAKEFDGPGPHRTQALHEPATTAHALGKQLQQVAITLINRQPHLPPWVATIDSRLSSIEIRLKHLELESVREVSK